MASEHETTRGEEPYVDRLQDLAAMPTREETSAAVGSVVRARRRAAGLSQEALAERAGLSQKHVARIERAERIPTIHALMLIARGLEIPVDVLASQISVEAERKDARGPQSSARLDEPDRRVGEG